MIFLTPFGFLFLVFCKGFNRVYEMNFVGSDFREGIGRWKGSSAKGMALGVGLL